MSGKINESTQWLYDRFQEKGFNVGKDVNEFDSLMRTNSESRKWAYDQARGLGWNVGKDYAEFEGLVNPTEVVSASAPTHENKEPEGNVASGTVEAGKSGDWRTTRLGQAIGRWQDAHRDRGAEIATPESKERAGANESTGVAEEPKEATAENGWQMTEKDKIAAAWNLHKQMGDFEERMKGQNAQRERMASRYTAEGRQKARDAEMRAQMLGLRTEPLVGATSDEIARMGHGAEGASQGEEGSEGADKRTAFYKGATVYDVVIGEDGKPQVQWMLPDGRLTTSLMEAGNSNAEARLSRQMKEAGYDPTKASEVALYRQWESTAPLREALDEAIRQEMANSDAKENEAWRAAYDTRDHFIEPEMGHLMRNVIAKSKMRESGAHDLEKMTESILSRFSDEDISALGVNSREDMKAYVYGRVADKYRERFMPKGDTEFFFRKVLDTNLFNTMLNLGNPDGLNYGNMMAMEEYGQNHKILGAFGTAVGMAFDPTTWVSGGVGSAAANVAERLVARQMLRTAMGKMSGKVAQRALQGKLATTIVKGSVGGAANFGTYEALKDAEQQALLGGVIDPNTGMIGDYSVAHMLNQGVHGLWIGSLTGGVGSTIGNVADKTVKLTTSTAGKIGVRAGELGVSTVLEGTVFSIPEWIEGDKSPMDVWTDNMAMMIGFKLHHGLKSAPEFLKEMRTSQRRTGETMEEVIRRRLDSSSSDFRLTADEIRELREKGYPGLGYIFTQYNNGRRAEVEESEGGYRLRNVKEGETRAVEDQELDGYTQAMALMEDSGVSQGVRAKVYWAITGRRLPVSTIAGVRRTELEDGSIRIESLSADGDVITSRIYKDERQAQTEEREIYRQAELNHVMVGERAASWRASTESARAAMEETAELYFSNTGYSPEEMLEATARIIDMAESAIAQGHEVPENIKPIYDSFVDAMERYGSAGSSYEPTTIAKDIYERTGINPIEVLKKRDMRKRTIEEQEALNEYVERVFKAAGLKEKETQDNQTPESPNEEPERLLLPGESVEKEQPDVREHKDGGMVRARLVDGRDVWIYDGKVVTHEDGSVDRGASDDMLIVTTEDGRRETVSVDRVKELGVGNDELGIEGETADAVEPEAGQEELAVGRHVELRSLGGGTIERVEEDRAEDGSTERIVTLRMDDGSVEWLTEDDFRNELVRDEELGVRDESGIRDEESGVRNEELGVEEETAPEDETSGEVEASDVSEVPEAEVPEAEAAGDAGTAETTDANKALPELVGRLPKDKEGKPDFTAVDAREGWALWQEMNVSDGWSREEALADAVGTREALEKELAALKKKAPQMKEPKMTGDALANHEARKKAKKDLAEAQAEHAAAIGEFERKIEGWKKIEAVADAEAIEAAAAERQAAVERAQAAQAEAQARFEERQREKAEKEAEQTARGAYQPHPSIKEKWDASPKIEGQPTFITLADGTVVHGRFVYHEAMAVTPSHDPLNGFVMSEGTPVTPEGQSVNPRHYDRDKDAQRFTENISKDYDARGIRDDKVVQDGNVISGNGGTMARQLAAVNGTDGKYVEALRLKAQQEGVDLEAFDRLEHPDRSFVPDQRFEYTPEVYDIFNRDPRKTMSRDEQSVRHGMTVSDEAMARMERVIGRFDTLGDFYRDVEATNEVLGLLHGAGVIKSNEMAQYRNGEELSGAGQDLIENIIIGKMFGGNPEAIRQLSEFKKMRESVITAISEIAANSALPDGDYRLGDELAAAIALATRAKKAMPDVYGYGASVSTFGRQKGMFDDEMGTSEVTDATVLLLADVLNSKSGTELRKVLSLYNKKASEAAAGQMDIFSGTTKTKEEILKDVNEYYRNATRKEQQQAERAAITARTEQRRAEATEQTPVAPGGEGTSGSREAGGRGRVEGDSGGDGVPGEPERPRRGPALDNNRRLEQRREQIQALLGKKYGLSSEQANHSELFYTNEKGETNLYQIPNEIFSKIGIAPLPFKLTESMALHVFTRHANEFGFKTLDDAIDYIIGIIRDADHVRQGVSNSLIFSIEDGRNKVVHRAIAIEIDAESGKFLGIKTSGYDRMSLIKKKPVLWESGADLAPEDVATPTVTTIKAQQGDEHVGSAEGQSRSSLDKDTTANAEKQEGGGEIGIRNEDLGVRSDKSGVGNEESGVRSEKRAKVEGVRRSIEAFDEADRKLESVEEDLFNSEDEDVDVKVERERRREARREAFGEMVAAFEGLTAEELREVADVEPDLWNRMAGIVERNAYDETIGDRIRPLKKTMDEIAHAKTLESEWEMAEDVAAAPGKLPAKKAKLEDYAKKPEKNDQWPQLTGVHHHEATGMAVATDLGLLIGDRHGYDAKHKGETIVAGGKALASKYPPVERVLPQVEAQAEYVLTEQGIKTMAARLRASLKGLPKKEAEEKTVVVRFPDGLMAAYNAKRLAMMLEGMEMLGLKRLGYYGKERPIVAQGERGVVLLMPSLPAEGGNLRMEIKGKERRRGENMMETMERISAEEKERTDFDRTPPKDAREAIDRIHEVVETSKSNNDKVKRKVIGYLTPRQKEDFQKEGIDVDEEWVHSIENSAVRHNQKHHGNESREDSRNQIAITEVDYEKIPDILENYDKVSKSPDVTRRGGNEVIIYEKEYEDGNVYYLEEKRDSRKSLSFHTMYKKKKGLDSSDGLMQEAPTFTSTTTSDNLQTLSGVKGNEKTFKGQAEIEDFGEKIDGARKDELRDFAKTVENATEQSLVEMPLGKVFKAPNLKKMVDIGAVSPGDAILAEAVMQTLIYSRTKPKLKSKRTSSQAELRQWAKETHGGIQLLGDILSGDPARRESAVSRLREQAEAQRLSINRGLVKLREWNPGQTFEDMAEAVDPVEVMVKVLQALDYQPGEKVDLPLKNISIDRWGRINVSSGTKSGAYWFGGSCQSVEEAVNKMVMAAKLKRGDKDVELPTRFLNVVGEGRELEETGRYQVMYWSRKNILTKTFDSLEGAEAFAREHNGKVSPEQVYGKNYKKYVVKVTNPLTGNKHDIGETFGSREEAEAWLDANHDEANDRALDAMYNAENIKKERKNFSVVTVFDGAKREYAIQESNPANPKWPFVKFFKSREEAEGWLQNNIEQLEREKAERIERQRKMVYFDTSDSPRQGEDYRGGRDATPEMYAETFGFRGVQFGNWTNQGDRREAMNQAYDAFMDLAKALGVSPRALSLDGSLGLAFGARGSGMASAHYEPVQVVINLTKTKGAGSLGHEWLHAADNYLAREAGVPLGFASHGHGHKGINAEVAEAVKDLVDVIEKSAYGRRSRDKGEYWGKKTEMVARLFAEWVKWKLEDGNTHNAFLSRGVNPTAEKVYREMNYLMYRNRVEALNEHREQKKPVMSREEFDKTEESLRGYPYPTTEELKAMAPYMQRMFDALSERERATGSLGLMVEREKGSGVKRDGEAAGVFVRMLDESGVPVRYENGAEMGERDGRAVMGRVDSDGTVVLNGDMLTAETPVHEYTHLWDEMVGRENPELWARGKELMKETPLWDEVLNDPAYADIRDNEDAVASEVHSRLTGAEGARIMERLMAEASTGNAMERAEKISLVEKLRSWVKDMFKALKSTLGRWTKRDLRNLTLEEFNRMTIRDLVEGLNPRREMRRSGNAQEEAQDRTRHAFAESMEDFESRQEEAVKETGVVMPGLAEKEVEIVEVPRHPFESKPLSQAEKWIEKNLVGKVFTLTDSEGREIKYTIGTQAIGLFLNKEHTDKSVNIGIHVAALLKLPDIISHSIEVEVHPDYHKVNKARKPENGYDSTSLIHRFYGAVEIDGRLYRVKTTFKEKKGSKNNAYSYAVEKIELLDSKESSSLMAPTGHNVTLGVTVGTTKIKDKIGLHKLSGEKLLQGVEKSYELDGEPKKMLLDVSPKASESVGALDDGVLFRDSDNDENVLYRIREEEAPKKTGVGYKVFVLKDGKLYPPMVANPGGEATPIGVWLDADAAPVAGTSKTGRPQVKAGGKGTQGGSGQLAYRPGWHLGEIPYALQFNRKDGATGEKTLFPKNFVWAEVEYSADHDYQDEAMGYGRNANGKFQHSLAGLPYLPKNGAYRYRTNPNPETDPWIITGAMKVKRLLKPTEVDEMVRASGREPQRRQEGAVSDAEIEALNKRISRRGHEVMRDGEGEPSDMDISLANDPIAKVLGKSTRSRKQVSAMAERQRRYIRARANELVEQLNLGDSIEILESGEGLEGRKAKAKGFYDRRTGKITIILGNHVSTTDIARTIFHEAVAHKGLRGFMGEKTFNEFLDHAYAVGDSEVKAGIEAKMREELRRRGKNHNDLDDEELRQARRTATEEYMAELAEEVEYDYPDINSWWRKIGEYIFTWLQKIGLKWLPKLTTADLKYILWLSHRYMSGDGVNIWGKARVEVERDNVERNLGVGRYESSDRQAEIAAEAEAEAYGNRLADIARDIRTLGKEEAANIHGMQYIDVVDTPEFLKQFGLTGYKFTLRYGVMSRHIDKDTSHNLTDEMWRELPNAITKPFAISRLNDRDKGFRLYTSLRNAKGEYVVVGVDVKNGGKNLEINSISTIFGRRNNGHLKSSEEVLYIDKEKITPEQQALLNRPNFDQYPDAREQSDRKDNGKNSTVQEDGGILFRDEEDTEREFRESMRNLQDADISLKTRATAAKTAAVKRATDKAKAMADARAALAEQMRGIRSALNKAASGQKDYDRATVATVVSLAQAMLRGELLFDVTDGEVSRLLSAVKNATGAKDLSKTVDKLTDIMAGNQLRYYERELESLMRGKDTKLNAQGIVVQGKLDADGQTMLDAMRRGMKMHLVNVGEGEAITDAIADAENRMTSTNEAIKRAAEMEWQGLKLAENYLRNIRFSEIQEENLRQEIKEAELGRKAGTLESSACRQFVSVAEESIRDLKLERVDAYRRLLSEMVSPMAASVHRAEQYLEEQKQRVNDIHHDANRDLQGRDAREHKGKATKAEKWANSSVAQFLFAPLGTFEQMLRTFGNKSVNGEGFLYDRFMNRGWIPASEKAFLGMKEATEALDAKVSEVFAKNMRWSDLYKESQKTLPFKLSFYDGGEKIEHTLTVGNALYIYAANKMIDGRMKLRRMGISEEDVERLADALDPRLLEIADWVQSEFLPRQREKYNATHRRMFGADMDYIENYFPMRINQRSRQTDEDISQPEIDGELPSTTTGAIKKRTRNSVALDVLGTDFFSTTFEHLEEMEQWNAFAEFNRDINTLLSYKKFKNRVMNMTSIVGGGERFYQAFKDACRIAAGTYRPEGNKSIDKAAVNIAKGVTAAKISFRLYTALKQLLSYPAYLSEASALELTKSTAKPWDSWNWCMENLPLFEKRWKTRQAGDYRLSKTDVDWGIWKNEFVDKLSRWGMSPNAFVDAVTVAMGSKAIYETKYKRFRKEGYSHEEADRKAKNAATVAYNQTQQSAEGAFLSKLQKDRTMTAVMFTVFRNASMSYTRQEVDALRNLIRVLARKNYRRDSIEFMTKQMIADGLDETQARKNAERRFNRGIVRDMTRVAIFGYVMQLAWNMGPYLAYMLLGNDDDKKDEMIADALTHAQFGSLEGFTGGNVISDALNMWAQGKNSQGNYNTSLLPMMADLQTTKRHFDQDTWQGVNDLVNLVVQAGVGVNPQTITDAVVAIYDACGGDLSTSKEAALCIMRVMQVPQSQIDNIYFDELDATAEQAQRMTPAELAERYARYKTLRNAPLTTPLRSEENRAAVEAKAQKRFIKEAKKHAPKGTLENEEQEAMLKEAEGKGAEAVKQYNAMMKQLREQALAGDIQGAKQTEARIRNFLNGNRDYIDGEVLRKLRLKARVDALRNEWLTTKSLERLDSVAPKMQEARQQAHDKLVEVREEIRK